MEQQQSSTDLTTLPPAARAAIALSSEKTEMQLRELVANSVSIVAVIDKDSRAEAHRAGMALRTVKTAITKIGKAAREDATAFSSAVIAEEKRLVGIVQPEEDRVLGLRDTYDQEQARIAAEVARKEAERKAVLQAKVDAIRNLPLGAADESADWIASEIEALRLFSPGPEFMEFAEAAKSAAEAAISAMTAMHQRQVEKEAQAAAIEAQRIENERIAKEQEAERVRLAEVAKQQVAELQAANERAAVEQRERDRVAADTIRQLQEQQAALAEERRKFEETQRAAAVQAEQAASDKAGVNAAEHEKEISSALTTGTGVLHVDGSGAATHIGEIHVDLAEPGADRTVVAEVSNQGAISVVPTMNLGQIATKLEFALTADFLSKLGFDFTIIKSGKFYHEDDFTRICFALMEHISSKIPSDS